MAAVTHSHEQHTIDCIEACMDCAHVCNACADDMIGMPHEDTDDLMVRCIRLCRDCADICLLAAQWMGRNSAFSIRICALCAEICEHLRRALRAACLHTTRLAEIARRCVDIAPRSCHQMVAETIPAASTGHA
jgi:hypothetical protein